MSDWDVNLYLRFENERTQPAKDLINRINVENPNKIIDIGCGSGNSTNALAQHFCNAAIYGVDNSQNMIDKASHTYPQLNFSLCDASKELSSLGNGFDIVFSNACLQWIPNHNALIRQMFDLLNVGGVLAVQIPVNKNEPLFRIIEEVANNSQWGFQNIELETNETLSSSEYYDILSDISSEFAIWETTYFHRMQSHKSLIEWIKSTRLRPYLNALTPEQGIHFEKEIEQRAMNTYKFQKNGEIIFKFQRLFFTAQRIK